MFGGGWNPAKCKTQLSLTTGRIKLLVNKRTQQQKIQRREIANLIETEKMDSARIKARVLSSNLDVEHVFY